MELTKMQENFFKDSKVRDEKGNLQICYHGTNSDFDTFTKISKGSGYWFSEDNEYALEHGKNLMEVYLNLKNPLDMTTIEGDNLLPKLLHECFEKETFEHLNEDTGVFSYKFRDFLKEKGYDGMIWDHNEKNTYVAFTSNQIKAVDNLYPTLAPNFKDNLTTLVHDFGEFPQGERIKIASALQEYQKVLSKEEFDRLLNVVAKDPDKSVREAVAKQGITKGLENDPSPNVREIV